MTDGSETRYIPAIRAEIERRWQALLPATQQQASLIGPLRKSDVAFEICQCTRWGDQWLATHLHAQEDVQILLEGIATLTREVRAAHDLYQEPLRLAAEEALKLLQERDEWKEEAESARVEIRGLEVEIAGAQKQVQDLKHERDEALSREADRECDVAGLVRELGECRKEVETLAEGFRKLQELEPAEQRAIQDLRAGITELSSGRLLLREAVKKAKGVG